MNHQLNAGTFSQRKEVRKLIKTWEQKAREHALVLYSLDPVPYHHTHGGSALLYELEDLLYYAAFFPTRSFHEKLQHVGLPQQLRRWFVPLTDILNELDALTATGEIYFEDGEWVLETIQTHLHAQWWQELVRWFDGFDRNQEAKDRNSIPTGKPLNEAAQQTKPNDPFGDVTPEDMLQLFGLAQKLEATADENSIARLVAGSIFGDQRTKFLGSIVVVANREKSRDDAFLHRFFPLFALLDRHQQYLSKEAFQRTPQPHLITYVTYQVAVVKSVVKGYWDYQNEPVEQSS